MSCYHILEREELGTSGVEETTKSKNRLAFFEWVVEGGDEGKRDTEERPRASELCVGVGERVSMYRRS